MAGIPEGKRIALVDTTTWLFPQHTMDALRRVLAQDSLDEDVVRQLVSEALAGQSIELQTTADEIQYRSSPTDTWHSFLKVSDIAAAVSNYERHEFPTPVGQWTVQHALGKVPAIAAFSATGERILGDEAASETSITVTWANPTSGFVVLTT